MRATNLNDVSLCVQLGTQALLFFPVLRSELAFAITVTCCRTSVLPGMACDFRRAHRRTYRETQSRLGQSKLHANAFAQLWALHE